MGGCDRNAPNDIAQLLRLVIIRDDVDVNWGAISENRESRGCNRSRSVSPECDMSA